MALSLRVGYSSSRWSSRSAGRCSRTTHFGRRIGRRNELNVPLGSAWPGVALFSALAWLALEVIRFGGTDAQSFFRIVRVVLLQSSFGIAWMVRICAAVALVLAAHFWPLRSVLLALSTTLVGTEAWIGHGNEGASVVLGMQLLHLLAASAWLGGLPPLAMVIGNGIHSSDGAERARAVLFRFSAMGIAAVALIALSGAIISFMAVDHWKPESAYVRVLAAKVTLFFAMVGIALYNRLHLMPKLDSASGPSARTLSWFWWTVAAEQALAWMVLLLASQLGMTSS